MMLSNVAYTNALVQRVCCAVALAGPINGGAELLTPTHLLTGRSLIEKRPLREAFGALAGIPPLDNEKRTLVRGARYGGRMRLLRRMEAGVIRSLEVEDASPTSTALMTLQRWMERIAEKEVERITAKCRRYQEQGRTVPTWARAGMDERFRRVEQMEQRVQMLLGIFASHGVLPLEFKPAYSVGDLLLQHLDALEQEAQEKGRVRQVPAQHFAKVYKFAMPYEHSGTGCDCRHTSRSRHPDESWQSVTHVIVCHTGLRYTRCRQTSKAARAWPP